MLNTLTSWALLTASLIPPPTDNPDRFFFGSYQTEKRMVVGQPDYIDGVLLREEGGFYWIRVDGGEIGVPTRLVYKIERGAGTAGEVEERQPQTGHVATSKPAPRLQAEATADTPREQSCSSRGRAIILTPGRYNPVLHTATSNQRAHGTPVTPHRADRGLSRYLAAQQHRRRTGH